ncbi:hypothetical protein BU23DRAFT_581083 [Bimuria novae-zelandiae CBS 107.79]|uniref:Uncharacterized protein n=1 Tax=Bimuria novae-zelandiae CBS 107.79 TaxID=1447943 RepID=A0A6A5V7R0_9PLEO|nr:hypothetical protein BU23DRAFT_581083 [Bimuria novae-zelandiae CBS 107.79]
MSRPSLTAFQKHLLFFSTPTSPPRLTPLSAPFFFYAPLPNLYSPVYINDIPREKHRCQLTSTPLMPEKKDYTCSDLLNLLPPNPKQGVIMKAIDQVHVVSFWAIAASMRTHRVEREDVERFQQGEWEESVVDRRSGKGHVLPLWRGGPIVVSWHSWAVRRVFGVRVYESGKGV